MAITLLPGKLLEADLLRDSVDLSVATDLIHFDVATNTVNIGTATPVADVQFQVAGTGASILPVGTTLERPATEVVGMMRFNTDLGGYEYWDGLDWAPAGTAFTPVSSQLIQNTTLLVHTLDSEQTSDSVMVSINGIVQIPTVSYTVAGDQLTLSEAPLITDVIEVRTFLTTAAPVATSVLTDGNVTITPNVTKHDVEGHLVPITDITYDLGSLTNRWRDLYLSGASIDLGGLKIKVVAGEFVFTEADGTTPASVSATVTDIDGGTY